MAVIFKYRIMLEIMEIGLLIGKDNFKVAMENVVYDNTFIRSLSLSSNQNIVYPTFPLLIFGELIF